MEARRPHPARQSIWPDPTNWNLNGQKTWDIIPLSIFTSTVRTEQILMWLPTPACNFYHYSLFRFLELSTSWISVDVYKRMAGRFVSNFTDLLVTFMSLRTHCVVALYLNIKAMLVFMWVSSSVLLSLLPKNVISALVLNAKRRKVDSENGMELLNLLRVIRWLSCLFRHPCQSWYTLINADSRGLLRYSEFHLQGTAFGLKSNGKLSPAIIAHIYKCTAYGMLMECSILLFSLHNMIKTS